jgi:hypothetical protein
VTGAELETMLERDELAFLGAGSRRECYAIPGTELCLKCYHDESTAPNATVALEIRKYRHNEKRNTCAQEYRYWRELKAKLPAYVFAAFPESLELVHLPTRGYALLESRVENEDGSACTRFSLSYRNADESTRAKLLKEFWLLVGAFAAYGVRFYDTQNIVVERRADNSFRLRVVDFEPAARTLIPIDSIFPFLIRGKVIRRATRYLKLHGRVEARYKGLPSRLRRKWDNLIATEGAKLGLSNCVPFLENKLLNDIFYRGTFNGKPCVVKCSSRSPDSIRNERDMLLRLHGVDLLVAVAPLGYWCSSDRHFAFIITDELPGPILSAVLKSDLSDEDRKRIASNLLRIVDALVSAGIVWRDLIPGNLLRDLSGHYRLIDAQLAVHREAPKECKFMQTNREYRLLLFAYNEAQHGKGWCDADFIRLILQRLNKNDLLVDEMRRLEEAKPKLTISKQITALDRLYVLLLKFEFAVQVYLRKGANVDSVRERLRRVNDILGGEA